MFENYEKIIIYRIQENNSSLVKVKLMGQYLSRTINAHLLHPKLTEPISAFINEFPFNTKIEPHNLPKNLMQQLTLFPTQDKTHLLLIPGEEHLDYIIDKLSEERNIHIPKIEPETAIKITDDNKLLRILQDLTNTISPTRLKGFN